MCAGAESPMEQHNIRNLITNIDGQKLLNLKLEIARSTGMLLARTQTGLYFDYVVSFKR